MPLTNPWLSGPAPASTPSTGSGGTDSRPAVLETISRLARLADHHVGVRVVRHGRGAAYRHERALPGPLRGDERALLGHPRRVVRRRGLAGRDSGRVPAGRLVGVGLHP